MSEYQMYLAGEWAASESGARFDLISPATIFPLVAGLDHAANSAVSEDASSMND